MFVHYPLNSHIDIQNGVMNQVTPRRLSAKDLHGWLQKGDPKPVLVDVREDQELSIAAFPEPVVHLPLSKFSAWIENFEEQFSRDLPVVVICHSGIRSWNFGTWLLEQAWGYEVWNLEGGIDAWSVDIDQTVARY